jgi:DNA-binding PadR family transcriptional regulator
MSLEHILLGLLRAPASGYDLKTIFDERIHYFWPAELSQIYPTLQRLERRGLLRSREAPAKRGPARRVYQTTPAGHAALRAWLEIGPEMNAERMGYQAKLYLLDELGDLRKTLQYMSRLREEFASRLEQLRTIERHWKEQDPAYPDSLSPQMFHVLLVLRKGFYSLAAHLDWCDDSIRRLRTRIAKENSHARTISKSSLDTHRVRQRRTHAVLDSRVHKKGRPDAR